ncbi:hypothetical protein [Morganella psychrotolerans]|uniref:hypothetical protein n=1 Tax=Morganella psychrotolerans TaxID=368603 RepID=UPI0039AFE338
MSKMVNGVKKTVNSALDIKDEICTEMIQGGVDPLQALKASAIVTKSRMNEIVERHFGNNNASEITSGLADIGTGVRPTH